MPAGGQAPDKHWSSGGGAGQEATTALDAHDAAGSLMITSLATFSREAGKPGSREALLLRAAAVKHKSLLNKKTPKSLPGARGCCSSHYPSCHPGKSPEWRARKPELDSVLAFRRRKSSCENGNQ